MKLIGLVCLIALVSGCCCCTPDVDGDGIVLTNAEVCEGIDYDDYGVDCGSVFSEGVTELYLVADYTYYGIYDNIDVDWYHNGDYVVTDTFPYDYEEYGEEYYFYTSLYMDDDSELPVGDYEVSISQDGVLLDTVYFSII